MPEVKVEKLLDMRDSVYGFSNLIEEDLKTDLKEIIKKLPKDKFRQYPRGLKYSLESNSNNLEEEVYKSEPIRKIISIFENEKILEVIGN